MVEDFCAEKISGKSSNLVKHCIVYMLYDNELYMLYMLYMRKSNKIYVMLFYVKLIPRSGPETAKTHSFSYHFAFALIINGLLVAW